MFTKTLTGVVLETQKSAANQPESSPGHSSGLEFFSKSWRKERVRVRREYCLPGNTKEAGLGFGRETAYQETEKEARWRFENPRTLSRRVSLGVGIRVPNGSPPNGSYGRTSKYNDQRVPSGIYFVHRRSRWHLPELGKMKPPSEGVLVLLIIHSYNFIFDISNLYFFFLATSF